MSILEFRKALAALTDRELLEATDLLIAEAAQRGSRNAVKDAAVPHAKPGVHIPASAPIATVAHPLGLGQEQTEFDVVLTEVDQVHRLTVVKALRAEFPGMTMEEAFSAVRNVDAHAVLEEKPLAVARAVGRARAEDLVRKLRAAGAQARMV